MLHRALLAQTTFSIPFSIVKKSSYAALMRVLSGASLQANKAGAFAGHEKRIPCGILSVQLSIRPAFQQTTFRTPPSNV